MPPDAPAPPEARLGTLLHQTYRLDRVLGVGGMGTVYAGEHVHLRRPVAVKVLHPQIAGQRVPLERFRREAQIASQLGHPGLVSVLDFNTTEDGAPYMVMELLEGETLQERLQRGPLPLEEACEVFAQLCEALHAVHEAGVVHRDLKPDNIFLLHQPAEQRVKVLDFGIGKFTRRPAEAPGGIELTLGQEVLGTPSYLAPEQATGDAHDADRRADVFALGTILYECLTGQRAFDGPHPVAIMRATLSDPAPRPSAHAPDLPRALDAVVARACAKDPKGRFPTAQALRDALLQACRAPAWDAEGDTLFDAEVDALRQAALKAYAAAGESHRLDLVDEPAAPAPGPAAPRTDKTPLVAPEPTFPDGDTTSTRQILGDDRSSAVTQRPMDRPTALLDTVPIPPEGYVPPVRWAQGHDATVDIKPLRRDGAAPEPSRGWVVTASTAALAVLLGVVVGMLLLKLMSRGASPSLALERSQHLQRQLGEGEQAAAQGRCEEAMARARAVLQQEPRSERARAILRTCRRAPE